MLDSVSTVWIQGDLPHSGGQHRPVHGVDTSTGHIEFYADVAYNGWLLYDVGKAKFHDAHLARRDEDVFGLYYDYLTLAVLADATEDAALAAELNAALRAAYARFTAGDARAARDALAAPLAAASDKRLRLQRRRPRPPRHGLALAAARDPPQGRAHLRATPSRTSTAPTTTSTARASRSRCSG